MPPETIASLTLHERLAELARIDTAPEEIDRGVAVLAGTLARLAA